MAPDGGSRELRFIDAITEGLRMSMEKHPDLVLMGQDIGNRPLLTLAVVMGLAGIQLFCFGLLGELLIRTYHESQDRPIYRVRATLRGGRAG